MLPAEGSCQQVYSRMMKVTQYLCTLYLIPHLKDTRYFVIRGGGGSCVMFTFSLISANEGFMLNYPRIQFPFLLLGSTSEKN